MEIFIFEKKLFVAIKNSQLLIYEKWYFMEQKDYRGAKVVKRMLSKCEGGTYVVWTSRIEIAVFQKHYRIWTNEIGLVLTSKLKKD